MNALLVHITLHSKNVYNTPGHSTLTPDVHKVVSRRPTLIQTKICIMYYVLCIIYHVLYILTYLHSIRSTYIHRYVTSNCPGLFSVYRGASSCLLHTTYYILHIYISIYLYIYISIYLYLYLLHSTNCPREEEIGNQKSESKIDVTFPHAPTRLRPMLLHNVCLHNVTVPCQALSTIRL